MRRWAALPWAWTLTLTSHWACQRDLWLRAELFVGLQEVKWRSVSTWTLHHREVTTPPCSTACSLLSFCWNAPLLFRFLPPSASPLLALYMSTDPFGHTMYLSSLACSCSDQTRAKRLILALRPGKLSQPSFFYSLSVSIWSNMLPGCRYGHQRAGWYFWPLCVRN